MLTVPYYCLLHWKKYSNRNLRDLITFFIQPETERTANECMLIPSMFAFSTYTVQDSFLRKWQPHPQPWWNVYINYPNQNNPLRIPEAIFLAILNSVKLKTNTNHYSTAFHNVQGWKICYACTALRCTKFS